MSDLNSLFQTIKRRDPNQAPFHQAVEEVFMSLQPFLAKNPQYTKQGLLERIVEPERVSCSAFPGWTTKGKSK